MSFTVTLPRPIATNNLTVRLTDADRAWVAAAAQKNDCTESAVIRQLIADAREQHEKRRKAS